MRSFPRHLCKLAIPAFCALLVTPCACRGRAKAAAVRTEKRAMLENLTDTADKSSESSSRCPGFLGPRKLGQIQSDDLTEASDLAPSAKNPSVIWSHNDSGGKPRLFALSEDGRDLGTYHLEGAVAEDWEDMAIGPGPIAGESYLYVGDIGANNKSRQLISVFRVEEPRVSLDQKPKKRKLDHVSRFDFVYPDLTSRDAESLMVDPGDGALYIVTKPRHGSPVVYRRRPPFEIGKTMTLELVTALNSIGGGPLLPTLVTSGDIARDGSMLVLRTYNRAYLWPRLRGESVDSALTRQPCVVPVHNEPQGEAIAFSPDERGYYTISEGRHPVLYYFERE